MVFTGIIQRVCYGIFDTQTQILSFDRRHDDQIWSDIEVGASVAINGVCLTVLDDLSDEKINFFIQRETLLCTTFGSLIDINESSIVSSVSIFANIERALSTNGEYGGHLVLGHVHGTGSFINLKSNKDGSKDLYFQLPPCPDELSKYLVPKGSITINGVSLTIAELIQDNMCRISCIPHTLMNSNFFKLVPKDLVNIEFDSKGIENLAFREYQNAKNRTTIVLTQTINGKYVEVNSKILDKFLGSQEELVFSGDSLFIKDDKDKVIIDNHNVSYAVLSNKDIKHDIDVFVEKLPEKQIQKAHFHQIKNRLGSYLNLVFIIKKLREIGYSNIRFNTNILATHIMDKMQKEIKYVVLCITPKISTSYCNYTYNINELNLTLVKTANIDDHILALYKT
jgi:riboflavin synthase